MERKDDSWVPNILPQFTERDFPITIVNTQLAISLRVLSDERGISLVKIAGRLLKFGLILKAAEQDPYLSIVRRDTFGNETDASRLFDEVLQESKADPGITFVGGAIRLGFLEVGYSKTMRVRMRIKLPSSIGNEHIELANMHHTSMENVLAGILKFGVNMANEEKNGLATYIFRDPENGDRGVSDILS